MTSFSSSHGVQFRSPRRAERTAVLLPATVTTLSSYQFPKVLNISSAGAKLRDEVMPSLGTTCMFRLDDVELLCKVVWRSRTEYGVRFDEPLLPAALARIRTSGRSAAISTMGSEAEITETEWRDAQPDARVDIRARLSRR